MNNLNKANLNKVDNSSLNGLLVNQVINYFLSEFRFFFSSFKILSMCIS